MVVSAAITYQGRYPDIYTSFFDNGPNYVNLYSVLASRSGYKGAVLGVPNGGSVFGVTLTNDQVQALGNAIRLHLATGSVNQTINGVQIVSSGTTSINVVVAAVSFTINLTNGDAANLAQAALQFVSSGAPHSPSTDQSPLINS